MPELHDNAPQLPEYENPPIAEVVCGVAFKPLRGMPAAQIGRLWDAYQSDYPKCEEQQPLPPLVSVGQSTNVSLSLEIPLPRTWFVSEEGNRLIQVQRDRFLHNWRKITLEDPYPRYSNLIKEFKKRYSVFHTFISNNSLGEVTPIQYELSYINHISGGDLWSRPSEIGRVLPDFNWRVEENRLLQSPESVNWVTAFELPDNSGIMSIKVRNGHERDSRVPVLLLELTAKGMGEYQRAETMWNWYDLAHEWIVRGFSDITDSAVQSKAWGRTR